MTDATDPVSTAPTTAEGAFRAALRDMLVFLGLLAVVGSLLGYLVAGLPGLWSVLMGCGIVLIFSGTTVISMLRTASSEAAAFGGVVGGLWLAKFLVVILAVWLLRPLDFYDKPLFGLTVVIGALGALALDVRAVKRARIPYLEPKDPGHGPIDPPA